MQKIIEENKICAIMRNIPFKITLDYAKSVFDGGVRMFEIAMNSSDAVKQIELLRRQFGDQAYVGAGTVTTKERCMAAEAAGAQFFLTPSVVTETLEYCITHNIPLLPGVMTPTDVSVCLEYGYSTMKLFPAGDLPDQYIRSLQGPFGGTEYVAVGGVSPDNISKYLDRGFIGVGIGSNLIPKEYIEGNQWDKARMYIEGVSAQAETNRGSFRRNKN